MPSPHLLLPCTFFSLFLTLFPAVFAADASIKSSLLNPMSCSVEIMTCNASLYHININLKIKEIATLYTVYPSKIRPIKYKQKRGYLLSVTCSCQNVSGTVGYFYDTTYKVKPSDTFYDVSTQIYSGRPLYVKEELPKFKIDADFPIHLPCGCVQSQSQIVVTVAFVLVIRIHTQAVNIDCNCISWDIAFNQHIDLHHLSDKKTGTKCGSSR